MKKSIMKDYKQSTLTVEDKIAGLIAIEELDGFLPDELIREYLELRFPFVKGKFKAYRDGAGRKKELVD